MVAAVIRDEDLPVPTGWRILIQIMTPPEKIGSIIRPTSTIEDEKHVAMTGKVVGVGPLAYKRDDMASAKPWCRIGDFIMFGKYTGTRFVVGDTEFRLANDDDVQAVLPNPDAIKPIPRGVMR